ncbi:MAG: phenylalanine--tRNA ligase subunit beta [Spirochaetales bacterium]|nr:phenylalanine--tRNA ligase subunit beta [Spirochaetales bacterium]
MPKIEIQESIFFKLLGQKMKEPELVSILEGAKAELDGWEKESSILKIELNDTNRPDLWSTAGLARQIRALLGKGIKEYGFLSRKGDARDTGNRAVNVDTGLKDIRPYIAAFVVKGPPIDEPFLLEIIQSQEKLCQNLGKRREKIAMGVYRADMIQYPVSYIAADPDKTSFVPLTFDNELSLREILKQHPKGIEFGGIVENFKKFPFIKDSKDDVLSFPPIINSATVGALQVGDNHIFVEMTGPDLDPLLLATSITACDFADAGYEVLPVKIVYPYDTPYGREIVTPYYFQKPVSLDAAYGSKLLGEKLTAEQSADYIRKAGNPVSVEGDKVVLTPVPYRNDFLHPVDVVEEIMIGRGLNNFEPVMPMYYTIGRISETEEFTRGLRDIMVGLGFQEMIYNYLGSKKDFIERMNLPDEDFIHISNPMTENYAVVRKSALPNLLASEAVSGNAAYPHKIFETGKVVCKDKSENYGARTFNSLSFLVADREAGFNDVNNAVSALFYFVAREYTRKETDDPRFIKGRTAEILCNGKKVGIMGEVHPIVLSNWGITMPCACAEIDIDKLKG